MFVAAHVLLYKFFASRYTRYSLRFVMIMAAGIALIVILDAVFSMGTAGSILRSATVYSFGIYSCKRIILVFYPHF